MPRPLPLALLALLAACAACAHAPARAPLPEAVWPEAPAAPRARLAALFPDPAAPPPRRGFWRALVDVVAGVDRDARRAREGLARPFGVAALSDGAVVVADPDGPAVLRFQAGRVSPVACRGREWAAPMAVAASPDGALYVADGGSAEVVRVGADGTCRALGTGALERPSGVALSGGRLFVADPPRHQVVVLSLEGAVLARWGARGTGDGELHFPTAVAATPGGEVLVVDALNFRVARFAADGAWRGAFGAPGTAGGDFERPKGVAVGQSGRVYVSDAQRDAVLVFGADGTFEYALGAPGAEPGRLTMPAGLALVGGLLYVADSHNQRVQVFELLGGDP
jgi:DNA-binding beta-propeller fold protein YncE